MTLATALRQGTELLARGGAEVARLTAEVLLAHAVHCDRTYLYAHPEQELREVEWIHYGRYLHERLQGKPTQYITRTQEFYGRPFHVSPDVLIPRPETELLVEIAIPVASRVKTIVDIGTGSGAIAVTLALETGKRIVGVDISQRALEVARRNAGELGAEVQFVRGDLLGAFADGSAGLVVSNPPYVAEADREALPREVRDWEPASALFGGSDGLKFYRRLIPEGARVLDSGGTFATEIGAGQEDAVAEMFGHAWEAPAVAHDLAGIPRVVHARKKS